MFREICNEGAGIWVPGVEVRKQKGLEKRDVSIKDIENPKHWYGRDNNQPALKGIRTRNEYNKIRKRQQRNVEKQSKTLGESKSQTVP